jgi:hypothetical protein
MIINFMTIEIVDAFFFFLSQILYRFVPKLRAIFMSLSDRTLV